MVINTRFNIGDIISIIGYDSKTDTFKVEIEKDHVHEYVYNGVLHVKTTYGRVVPESLCYLPHRVQTECDRRNGK